MGEKYTKPEFEGNSFRCPHCEVHAQQSWVSSSGMADIVNNCINHVFLNYRLEIDKYAQKYIQEFLPDLNKSLSYLLPRNTIPKEICFSRCDSCKRIAVWANQKIVYPKSLTAPIAHEDMPEDVKKIYDEARAVSEESARAAAALLRVALEKLTVHLGETTGHLNSRIENLKKKGLPEKVIQSLDIVRINANEGGSHAGQIDFEGGDNEGVVDKLFWLVNFIVEKTISDKKQVDEMLARLPEDKKQGIDNRDK